MGKIKPVKHQNKVYIYFYKKNVHREPTGIPWNVRNQVESQRIITSILNRVQRIVNDYVIKNGFQPTGEYVKNKLKEKQLIQTNYFLDLFEDFYKLKSKEIRRQSLKDYRSLRNSILDYQKMNKIKLTFESISVDFIKKYVEFLSTNKRNSECKTKGNLNDTTISKRISSLRTYFKFLEENEIFEFPLKVKSFKPVEKYPIDIISLTIEEQRDLYNFELSDKRLIKVRDIFLFGCMTSLRYSDIITLESKEVVNNKIIKIPKKARKEFFYKVNMNDTAVEIWEKYNHNLNHFSNQKFNKYLKELCKMSELFDEEIIINVRRNNIPIIKKKKKWELITSHTGRRSFITNHISTGTTINEIMEMTSHTKIDTLVKYINKYGSTTETVNKIKL